MSITTLMFETTLRLSSTKLFPREDLPLEADPRRSVVLYFTLNFKRNESSYHFGFFPPTRGIAKSNAIFTKFLFLWFAYYCDGNAL